MIVEVRTYLLLYFQLGFEYFCYRKLYSSFVVYKLNVSFNLDYELLYHYSDCSYRGYTVENLCDAQIARYKLSTLRRRSV
jgi:hypothetical protein